MPKHPEHLPKVLAHLGKKNIPKDGLSLRVTYSQTIKFPHLVHGGTYDARLHPDETLSVYMPGTSRPTLKDAITDFRDGVIHTPKGQFKLTK
jgi:hypothetical protein